jgi:hypothetical protein
MAFQSRFFRIALPARTAASALGMLAILGSLSGTSAQAPATAPLSGTSVQPVVTAPPATAPAAPKLQAAAPVTTIAPLSGEFTQGALQIVDLLASLTRFDPDAKVPARKLGFEIPERAVNEYLAYSLHNRPRPGISAITVTLLPKNDISATIEIDFSSVKQWAPELLPEPLRPLLSGKQTLQLNAHFEVKNGSFTFALKDVHGPDSKPLANKIMTDLLQSLGSHQPESYDASKPITLPFGLKRVWTEKQAVFGET